MGRDTVRDGGWLLRHQGAKRAVQAEFRPSHKEKWRQLQARSVKKFFVTRKLGPAGRVNGLFIGFYCGVGLGTQGGVIGPKAYIYRLF